MARATFLRVLDPPADEKDYALLQVIRGEQSQACFAVEPREFSTVPGSPFAYWVPDEVLKLFRDMPCLEAKGRSARLGLSTKNDARFVRAHWEVPPTSIGPSRKWARYANGSPAMPFYWDHTPVVLREADFRELRDYLVRKFPYLDGNASWILHDENDYLRPAIGWPLRAQRFCAQALPPGFVFSARTYALLLDNEDDLLWTLGVFSSRLVHYLLSFRLGKFSEPEYVTGPVRTLPFPAPTASERHRLEHLAGRLFALCQGCAATIETTSVFVLPDSFRPGGSAQDVSALQREIDEVVYAMYRLSRETRDLIHSETRDLSYNLSSAGLGEEEDGQEDGTGEAQTAMARFQDLLSWAVGCVIGRWDIRLALDPSLILPLPGPFQPLPTSPPGMLTGPDGLPAAGDCIASDEWLRARPNVLTLPPEGMVKRPSITQAEYPLEVDWDGVLVDDDGHSDDIVGRVQDVLALVFVDRAEAIEQEACTILGVDSLREYFRKRFFDFHIKRYSKSRRKAPIYWYLATRRKSYGLWLYYHRLTRDTLYRAVQSYIEPKIAHTRNQIAEQKARRAALGDETGTGERRRVEKELDRLAGLEAELVEFKEALQRVTAMGYEPDLNDGVILNIAPLHQLVPWKEAERMWKELVSGKYEWSSMSKHLRSKGIVR